MKSHQLLSYTKRNSDRANIPKINRKALNNFTFNTPPISLQNKFAEIVNKIEAIKTKYEADLTELENLYGSLSQRAFKGELDLSKLAEEN